LLSCQQKNSIMKKRKDCFDIKFWWITWSQQAPGERVEIDLDIIQCHSFRFKIAFFLLAIIPIARIIIKKTFFFFPFTWYFLSAYYLHSKLIKTKLLFICCC
jgi:hypothetical protein